MALLWVDGFDKWGTINAPTPTTIPSTKYKASSVSSANIVPGRFGGYALSIDVTSTYFQTPHLHSGGGDKTLICGLAYRSPTLRDGMYVMNFLLPTEGSELSRSQWSLRLSANSPSSGLEIYRGNTLVSSNTDALLSDNTWAYIEMKVYCDPTSGTCNVYVDGSEVIGYSGNTSHRSTWTEATAYSSVYLCGQPTYGIVQEFDDMYVADGSGNGITDVIGSCRVETLSPSSDVSGNWTPNTGPDMYDNIDSQSADTDFISTSTSGNRAIFETDNLSANAALGTVQGVMINAESQQLGDSIQYAKGLTQNGSGNTVQHSGNFAPGTDGTVITHSFIMEDDPDGNAWTSTTVNQLRIGVEAS